MHRILLPHIESHTLINQCSCGEMPNMCAQRAHMYMYGLLWAVVNFDSYVIARFLQENLLTVLLSLDTAPEG